jgi:hypothetical protein
MIDVSMGAAWKGHVNEEKLARPLRSASTFCISLKNVAFSEWITVVIS